MKEINEKDLKDFLNGGSTEKIKLEPSEMKSLSKDTEDTPDEGTVIPSVDPTMMPGQNTQNEQLKWAMTIPRVGNVNVEAHEKKLYVKGLLEDTPIKFDIRLDGVDCEFKFQSKTAIDLDIMFLALAKDIDEGLSRDASSHLSRLQQYSLCVMLMQVGSTAFETYTADESKSYADQAEDLRLHRHKVFSKMQASRINMLTYAGAIFEAKLATCDQNIHNRSFYNPAD